MHSQPAPLQGISSFLKTCRVLLLSLLCLSVFAAPKLYAQQEANYAIVANIVYRFTKYIDWPENKKSGDFVIGIVGDSPLYDALNNFILNKSVGAQKIVVRRFSRSETAYSCHILFVSEDESGSFKKIAARTAGSSILLVSESGGLTLKGSCINFIVVADHLKLEISQNNIEQRHLSIASELLQLGTAVK
jgi:hypothetical protein